MFAGEAAPWGPQKAGHASADLGFGGRNMRVSYEESSSQRLIAIADYATI